MNGAESRAELIDPLLTEAGWGVVEGSRSRREFSITPGRIDGVQELAQEETRTLAAHSLGELDCRRRG